MLTWRKLYTFDSLLIAATQVYTKCLFQKNKCYTTGFDGKTLFDWARHSKANLVRLHNQLKTRRFGYQPLSKKIIKFPNKTREVYVSSWRDRAVDAMLNTELNRALNHEQSPNSYAYRLANGGVDICQTNIAKALFSQTNTTYIVKRDISNYYPSINKEKLLKILERYIDPNDYLFKLIADRVNFHAMYKDVLLKDDSGVPFGSAISCFLANLYLVDLDRAIEKLNVRYFRYADDILIFGTDKTAVKAARVALDEHLAKLDLSCKPSHTMDICFYGDDDEFKRVIAFKHLGLYFKDNKLVGISREKVRKILNIFKRAIGRRSGTIKRYVTPKAKAKQIITIINKILLENIRPVAVIDYYLKHMTDEHQLQQMDLMIAELVLAKSTGRGYKKSNFKIVPFNELREMGLPSLRHRMKLLQHGHIESNFFDFRIRKKNSNKPKMESSGIGKPTPLETGQAW
jgi:retron-type reverse transcriptase